VGEAIELGGLTGNPMFSRLWTLLHLPLINLPVASGPQGLPVGIQLAGRHGADNKLLADAQWVRDRLS
jgi:Asp-tRNA(Asn)/Glu-tRNA(Gln) amidotransferase A subunit family amidase